VAVFGSLENERKKIWNLNVELSIFSVLFGSWVLYEVKRQNRTFN
jgi:hypothetical protein